MAVYVDNLFDYGWHLGRSCHMFADTEAELHTLADKIGMRRSWYQANSFVPHYDLTARRRRAAVEAGAIELDRRQAAAVRKRLRLTHQAPIC